MNIFVAIWEDRHCDTTVHLFTKLEQAITWSIESIKEHIGENNQSDIQNRKLTEDMIKSGWKLYMTYGPEGDNIRVVEKELDEEVKFNIN